MDYVTGPLMEWAVASQGIEPDDSGDGYIVHPWPDGALLGVVDGVGHGHEAAAAARESIRLLEGCASMHPVAALRACHEGLIGTRGVVLALAWLDGAHDCMTWLAVGNVQCVLSHGNGVAGSGVEILLGQSGVVGRRLPALRATIVQLSPGDLLVLATDGIHSAFSQMIPRLDRPRQVADFIMDRHRTGMDDALVLAVRYRGAFA